MSEQHASSTNRQHGSFFTSRGGIVLIGFLLIAGYFLVTEHAAHLALAIPYLPYALLAACPLMHVFMHGGHGHHHHPDQTGSSRIGAASGGDSP